MDNRENDYYCYACGPVGISREMMKAYTCKWKIKTIIFRCWKTLYNKVKEGYVIYGKFCLCNSYGDLFR